MRVFVPEISWHNRLPALSLDISKPTDEAGNQYRIATGGNDCRVYIWLISIDDSNDKQPSNPAIQIKAGLRRHQRSVGAVRFSPTGNMLASGDDDGYIYLWEHRFDLEKEQGNTNIESDTFMNDDGFEDLELWRQHKILRGHVDDICDIAWSKDGQYLLSGSVDNSAILWDTIQGTKVWMSDLKDFKGYVQGVAIDPHAQFMAAISSDRTLRIYNFTDRRLLYATRRMDIKSMYKAFFCDDTVKTFCRRLEFSPDGQFLLAPTSCLVEREHKISPTATNGDLETSKTITSEKDNSQPSEEGEHVQESKTVTKNIELIHLDDTNETPVPSENKPEPSPDDSATSIKSQSKQRESQDDAQQQQQLQPSVKKYFQALLVFRRSSFNKPTHFYPTGEVALCARFSPVIYQLRDNETNFWDIPYRIVFAVVTTRNVLIYDSQQPRPIGYISQIHLARITDLAWSSDGRMLMVSSYDGYSTVVIFEQGEFGEIYTGPLIEPFVKQVVDESKIETNLGIQNGKCEVSEKPSKKGQKRVKAPKETVAAKKEKLNPEPDQEQEVKIIATKKSPPKKLVTPTRLPESATLWRYLQKEKEK